MLLTLIAAFLVGSTATSDAQVRVGIGIGYGHGPYYRPYYSPYWYNPWFYGGWGQGPYPYGYPMHYAIPDSSIHLDVTPKQAEVYVDGYYAGIVDDFDGMFQRLRVAPGNHQLELWMDGYRVVKQSVYLKVDETLKLKYAMEKLGPGEVPEAKPTPPPPPMNMQTGGYGEQGGYPPQSGYAPQGGGYPPPQQGNYPPPQVHVQRTPPPPQQPPNGSGAAAGYGTLSIRVQPTDADIAIDGESWRGPDGHDRLIVDIAEGSHTVEIRKAGYRTYVTQIDVHHGQTTPLNVSLRTGDQQ
jgi:hypothetical protein